MEYNHKNITIGAYNEYLSLLNETSLEGLYKRLAIISIVTKIQVSELEDMDYKDLIKLGKQISDIDLSVKLDKFNTTITLNDMIFKSNSTHNRIIVNVGESIKLNEIREKTGNITLLDVAAIMFTNEDTTFEDRKLIFEDMPLEYIIPYLIYRNEKS
jgi:hypothetical protein